MTFFLAIVIDCKPYNQMAHSSRVSGSYSSHNYALTSHSMPIAVAGAAALSDSRSRSHKQMTAYLRYLQLLALRRVSSTRKGPNAAHAFPTSCFWPKSRVTAYDCFLSSLRALTTVQESRYSTTKQMQCDPLCCINCHFALVRI